MLSQFRAARMAHIEKTGRTPTRATLSADDFDALRHEAWSRGTVGAPDIGAAVLTLDGCAVKAGNVMGIMFAG